jgi:hypothetical protein
LGNSRLANAQNLSKLSLWASQCNKLILVHKFNYKHICKKATLGKAPTK